MRGFLDGVWRALRRKMEKHVGEQTTGVILHSSSLLSLSANTYRTAGYSRSITHSSSSSNGRSRSKVEFYPISSVYFALLKQGALLLPHSSYRNSLIPPSFTLTQRHAPFPPPSRPSPSSPPAWPRLCLSLLLVFLYPFLVRPPFIHPRPPHPRRHRSHYA